MIAALASKVSLQHQFSTALWDLRREPGDTGFLPFSPMLSYIHSKTANRSRLPPRSVLGAPHRGAAPEPAGETKSFCLCHKTCENTGFSPVFFLHVLCENGIHSGSDCWFLYLVLSVSNRSHPLQHQKHTRFRLFRAFPGAFFSFSLFLGRKIFACSFVHPAA
mgnify:CR=1 FL=1